MWASPRGPRSGTGLILIFVFDGFVSPGAIYISEVDYSIIESSISSSKKNSCYFSHKMMIDIQLKKKASCTGEHMRNLGVWSGVNRWNCVGIISICFTHARNKLYKRLSNSTLKSLL